MDAKQLEEIRARCEAAIPGRLVQIPQFGRHGTKDVVLAVAHETGAGIGEVWLDICTEPDKAQAMADLWANAQADIAALLEDMASEEKALSLLKDIYDLLDDREVGVDKVFDAQIEEWESRAEAFMRSKGIEIDEY